MLSQERRVFLPFPLITGFVLLISLVGLLFITACGGGGGLDNEPPTLSPTSVQFKIGDGPADRLLGLEVNLTAVHVKDSKGNQINVLPATRRLEFLHTAGTLEPVALLEVPQGTYTEAAFQGSNLHVTYLSYTEGGFMLNETAIDDLETITVPISPALTVGTGPLIVSIDFDVASFISFDPVDGHVILNDPKFTVTTSPIMTGFAEQRPEDGGLEGMLGVVSAVSATDFILNIGQNAMPLGFTTNSGTVFKNATLSTLPSMIAKVNGMTKPDGSLLATEVEALVSSNGGAETEGVIFWRYPEDSWFWLTPQDGNGAGFEFSPTIAIGRVIDVDAGNTSYAVNTDGMDMTGAAFNFDANAYPYSVRAGQRVRLESTTGLLPDPSGDMAGIITPQKVNLEKQAVGGTVSNYTVDGDRAFFVLQLPPKDSYLTILSSAQGPPVTYINVWQQAGTNLHGITSVQNGDVVRVRGLLFSLEDGNFVMVAQRIWE
jgi:hypothetical protein